ncbi:unnamed protein product [Linum tenue]|uniref:Thaumatin-like protein n=1 Tax=Linum tenue TaxID=586396 RepID=A0AAV0IUM4_9ROSI|nr:unnamed protein product [Linum tenue]
MINKCNHPVWPGIQPGSGSPILARGGFHLPPNKAQTLTLPPLWSGRFWGRHGCSFDASGRGRCATGDCGSLYCNGLGGAPPATLAEITLGRDQDLYCCTGAYGNPQTCKPTAYSRIFKAACPRAYSYAYDDPTSISTCTGGNYLVTFCPPRRR